MTQVGITASAGNLCSAHTEAVIRMVKNMLLAHGLEKAWRTIAEINL